MTTMTKTITPTVTPATSQRTGFATIPPRIRDVRDAQVPPLVVEPMAEQNKAIVRQSLGELGITHEGMRELAQCSALLLRERPLRWIEEKPKGTG